MNLASARGLFRPLAGLAMIAGLVGAPLATAASAGAATPAIVAGALAAPTENPYCDYRSGYLCQSYGYPPDYVPGGYGYYPHHHRHWHHWRHWE